VTFACIQTWKNPSFRISLEVKALGSGKKGRCLVERTGKPLLGVQFEGGLFSKENRSEEIAIGKTGHKRPDRISNQPFLEKKMNNSVERKRSRRWKSH